MPWQRYVADVLGELLPNGLPAYPEGVVTVPRQSGKTLLEACFEVDRCLYWGMEPQKTGFRPQLSVYTAQSGSASRKKWLGEFFPLIQGSRVHTKVKRYDRSNGNEGIEFKTGSRIRVLSTSEGSGHGLTIDQAVLDEIWDDTDDRREQALGPAMVTRADAQLLVCSTAGTPNSVVLNRKIEAGRKAVEEDSGEGLAFFEWAAPDNWDRFDVESYPTFMPAVCPDPPCKCDEGWRHTITVGAITRQLHLPEAEFIRAYGNRPTMAADQLIPKLAWEAVKDAEATAEGKVRFALDVAEDRSSAAICAASSKVIEVIEHAEGTNWIVERCNELSERYDSFIAVDVNSPAGAFVSELKRVHKMNSHDVLDACGRMYDAIMQGKVTFRTDPDFDKAIAGAAKRQVGDRWGFSRRASNTDITPLMAATLAFGSPESRSSAYAERGLEVI